MADLERDPFGNKKWDKKLIVDCDEEIIGKLSSLAGAAERSNAWVVRRLIEASFARVYPGSEFGGPLPKANLDALKESGLLGLDLFYDGK
jgi:methylmalonyl-CoA mutase cobalamin-binding subunit